MEGSNSVHNPIVPGFKLMKDEHEVKIDNTLYKQIVGSLMYLTATQPATRCHVRSKSYQQIHGISY